MFGGGGGMNPRKMKQMMKQMGIDVEEIDAEEVVIKTADGRELVFDDADVTQMDARGQQTYQVIGDPEEREATESGGDAEDADEEEAAGAIPESDVEIVVQRTGATPEEARAALEGADGDLATAIDVLE
ncbi:nascent polypeptide-associated complex protein [Halarchaeum sp. CBA1220]|uniref:nascent polypeptide-associated complex protein n=1 Tax=Halarchaeum sp. CBA1220 TaxID=1853682 RepID=UPI000F3A8C88|nr:nascent polypeptide-associated complex protein [Halarchaeum sp. CBA1220]QLC33870.1 nascent polypeptide-associated complex protein [Halarchaeum sp. CBA1220]